MVKFSCYRIRIDAPEGDGNSSHFFSINTSGCRIRIDAPEGDGNYSS